MNIVIIHQYFLEKHGAGGSRFNQFAKYWAHAGNNITVIAGTVDYATGGKSKKYKKHLFIKEKIDSHITILRCYVSESYNKNFLGRLFAYVSFTVSSTLAGIATIKKADIIIASSPPLFVAIPAYIISKIKKIPLIFEVRDLWPKFAIDTGILKNSLLIKFSYWLEKFIYQKAHSTVVLTPDFQEYLIHTKKLPANKITYIPNGADLDILKPGEKNNWVRKKYKWDNKFIIMYVGAHGVANDLWQLIDTAEILQERKDILFVLIGDGMEKPKLQSEAKQRKLTTMQFITPVPKEKIADFINAADVCTAVLQPIFTTTYPNKVFDYMACAKPIILPIDGAVKKLVVQEAEAGIFVEPRNAKHFKNAILTLNSDVQKAKQMGQNGYNFVKQNFNRTELAQEYLNTMEKIMT